MRKSLLYVGLPRITQALGFSTTKAGILHLPLFVLIRHNCTVILCLAADYGSGVAKAFG